MTNVILLNCYIPILLFFCYNNCIILFVISFYPILTTAKMFREMLLISTVLRAFPFQHPVLYTYVLRKMYNDVELGLCLGW